VMVECLFQLRWISRLLQLIGKKNVVNPSPARS
jgi:hypothetical protein